MRLHLLPRATPGDGLEALAEEPWRRADEARWVAHRHGYDWELRVANDLDVVIDGAEPQIELRRDGVSQGRLTLQGAVDVVNGYRSTVRELPVGGLNERFGEVANLREGMRGFVPLRPVDVKAFAMASRLLTAAFAVMTEPEARWAWERATNPPLEDEDNDWDDDWTLGELLDVPLVSPDGEPFTEADLEALPIFVMTLAMHVWGRGNPEQEFGVGGAGRGGKQLQAGFMMPEWASLAILADRLLSNAELRIVPVDKQTAFDFVKRHHSALPDANPRGLLFALGVARGARLVGVALCNTPSGRYADPHGVVELTRVATDGTVKGAASKLVARVLDTWRMAARGAPSKLVTYSLTSEEGATYKALKDKGLRPVARVEGRDPAGARGGVSGDPSLARISKVRWEAGPGAGAADWSLVAPSRD